MERRAVFAGALATLAAAGLAACVPTQAASSQDGPPGITYYRDVEPILRARCVRCHEEGGSAPFALTSWAQANLYRRFIQQAVEEGTMPPWLPGPGCADYAGDASLTVDEIATLSGWADRGGPAGDPASRPEREPSSQEPSPRGTVVAVEMPVEYAPPDGATENRCFLADWPLATATYVTGFGAQPADEAIVRRVVAYLAQPAAIDDLVARDEGDPGPGWSCPGTADPTTTWLGGWAVGSGATRTPEGTGLIVPPGSAVVLEIAYDTTTAPASPDRTVASFETADSVEKAAKILPWADPKWVLSGEMPIPAGQSDVSHSFAADPTSLLTRGEPVAIHAVTMQMRSLGTRGSLTIRRSSGEDECLLDLPSWDPGWQQMVRLARPVTLSPGDELAIECHWDNGPDGGSRRLVDEQPRVPTDVNWGDAAGDEMCLALLYASTP
ncbi:MAG: monooxygenase [Deltaproteobacteria bacterium]|nr:monooxygenase [Deltaproteobacteria bacterium]